MPVSTREFIGYGCASTPVAISSEPIRTTVASPVPGADAVSNATHDTRTSQGADAVSNATHDTRTSHGADAVSKASQETRTSMPEADAEAVPAETEADWPVSAADAEADAVPDAAIEKLAVPDIAPGAAGSPVPPQSPDHSPGQ